MGKKLICFGLLLNLLLAINVNAETIYYTNKKGVNFTEIEYNNVLKINGIEVLENMSQELLDKYQEFYSYPDITIETATLDDYNGIMPFSQTHETPYKKLMIGTISSPATYKMVVVRLDWKAVPNVKSYDVMGIRLYNTTLASPVDNMMLFDGVEKAISGSKSFANGYGASIKLQNVSRSLILQQSFKVNPGGTVFASYQHAVRNISLSDSLNFTLSISGLGNVFNFGNDDLFDSMAGVNLDV